MHREFLQKSRSHRHYSGFRRRRKPGFMKFPVFFPVLRELGAETGSRYTVSSARQLCLLGWFPLLRNSGHTCLALRAVATLDPGCWSLPAPCHGRHHVVATVVVENASSLRLGAESKRRSSKLGGRPNNPFVHTSLQLWQSEPPWSARERLRPAAGYILMFPLPALRLAVHRLHK